MKFGMYELNGAISEQFNRKYTFVYTELDNLYYETFPVFNNKNEVIRYQKSTFYEYSPYGQNIKYLNECIDYESALKLYPEEFL